MATRAHVGGVPLIAQDEYYCGPASLAMVLQWSGADVSQAQIAARSFTAAARGTYQSDMVGAARRHGHLAVRLSGLDDILAEVAAGHPVIVFQNLGLSWAPRWHYAVVVGYDLADDRVDLHSGGPAGESMPVRLFERTWRRGGRWALVVLPPDRLPVRADPWDIVRAAAALERTGHLPAAETVYGKGAARWPEAWIWPFGLGNVRHARGDLQGALRAFERAHAADPTIVEVRQNLAAVRAEIASGRHR